MTREKERRAFTQGYIEGVIAYAIWKEGKQKVGIMQHDLGAVSAKILTGKDQYFETGWSQYCNMYPNDEASKDSKEKNK